MKDSEEIIQLGTEDLKDMDDTEESDWTAVEEDVFEIEVMHEQAEETPAAADDEPFRDSEDKASYPLEEPSKNEPKTMRLLLDSEDIASEYSEEDFRQAEESLLQSMSKNELLEKLVFYVKKSLGCRTAELFLEYEDSEWIPVQTKKPHLRDIRFYGTRGLVSLLAKKRRLLNTESYSGDEYGRDLGLLDALGCTLVLPILFKEKLIAFAAAGDYIRKPQAEQIAAAMNICCGAGILLNSFLEREKLENEVMLLKGSISGIAKEDRLISELIGKTDIKEISGLLNREFAEHAIESCSLFIKNLNDSRFFSAVCEDKDYMGFRESPAVIDEISLFMNMVNSSEPVVDVANFQESPAVHSVFSAEQIRQMNVLKLYPFLSGDRPAGFTALFRMRPEVNSAAADDFLRKISDYIFPTLYMLQMKEAVGGNANALYRKINLLLKKADGENAPVSLLMLSVKNFRRFDGGEIAHILSEIESSIAERLTEDAFAAPCGKNAFIAALPGKSRNQALRLGTDVRNSVVDRAGGVLIGFSSVQYPEDGKDLFGLLNLLD